MLADHHCKTVQSSSKSCSNNGNNNKKFWMNYFAKTVYSIATKTCPLAVYRRFSQAKSEGLEGAKMGTFEKWGQGHHGSPVPPPLPSPLLPVPPLPFFPLPYSPLPSHFPPPKRSGSGGDMSPPVAPASPSSPLSPSFFSFPSLPFLQK